MKSVFRQFVLSARALFFLVLIPIVSQAQLATKIDVIQNSQGYIVETKITLDRPLKAPFILFKQAQIISSTGFVITLNAQQDYVLTTQVGNAAQVKYLLKLDQTSAQFLTEDMNWYPRISDDQVSQTFLVTAQMLTGFQMVHSATGRQQDGVSAVLGPLIKYEGLTKKIVIYLQKPDPALAQILLENLENYLISFQSELSPYPYDQFSVVESPDEIGFAFPRMTWIGSNLLRFPFILKTSLPHELLHSWWGNSVFVNYPKGNWCEGLTVFGADYALLSESEKTTYRQKALLEYVDYVKNADEISLSQFVSRGEDRALQAIGYNKSLMMFVMLQDLVGQEVFKKALSLFNQNFQFKAASYQDLFQILKTESPKNQILLENFYNYWILDKGAIQLNQLTGQYQLASNGKFDVKFQLPSDQLRKFQGIGLEVLIYATDGTTRLVTLDTTSDLSFQSNVQPAEFTVDPNFKIFRTLSDDERPITFSKYFGGVSAEVVLDKSTLPILQSVFTSITFASKQMSSVDFSQPGILLVENGLNSSLEINNVLKQHGVQIFSNKIQFGSESISLDQNGFFISFKVLAKMVIVFKTNESLPVKRWFERWSRYGAQGYVVLTPTGAAKQGLWSTPFKQSFKK